LIGALVPVIMAITVLFALSQQGSGGFVHGRRVVSYAFGLFGAVLRLGRAPPTRKLFRTNESTLFHMSTRFHG
jgi:hypothetical protein